MDMSDGTQKNDTPAMGQYRRFKQQHPECVLFFRLGDFYEMFYDDAELAQKTLGLALAQRNGVPMAGVPYHAVDRYLHQMIRAGHRVAVCDQVEDAKLARGVVKRDVTRIITPGTLTDDALLEEGRENPLAALRFESRKQASVAWAELSTGAFRIATFPMDVLNDELARIGPRELLYEETADGQTPELIKQWVRSLDCSATARPAWQFRKSEAVETLHRQFQVKSLAGFGLAPDDPALRPASAVIHYLLETQRTDQRPQVSRIPHLQPPHKFRRDHHLVIDQVSLQSLEVERTIRSSDTKGSLLGIFQDCRTPMGKRTLRQWLCYPLRDREPIERRLRVVAALIEDGQFLDQLRGVLGDVQDVQRMIGRIAVGRALPRDLVALGTSAAQAANLTDLLAERPAVEDYCLQLECLSKPLTELAGRIAQACVEAPQPHLREGGLIRDGFDAQLDEYRALQQDSHSWLARYQKQLVDETGIANLKVGFNKVFGFYIELSATNRERAPDNWTRKQTLKNAERFITPELKEYEGKVLSADQRSIAREQELFTELCTEAQDYLSHLYDFGRLAAALDVLGCFARRAIRRQYVQPEILDDPSLNIRGGRHPVLDELLADKFVPNDVRLGPSPPWQGEARGDSAVKSPDQAEPAENAAGEQASLGTLALITGPNMSGKSTYIRQTALIVLLAHAGSFVPAESATIGLCDRIFTRVGASDELHAGQSTFMVEMTETANICHHATVHSLVILDEIGRGTSTLDGLALAWAIAEFLANHRCRALFATHYHELTALSEQYGNIVNLNVSVREWQDEIVFLHRILPGATNRSYGIHVAKIAGLPQPIVDRANELLAQLEVSHDQSPTVRKAARSTKPDAQLPLFTEFVEHPVVDRLRQIDLENTTPVQAFKTLFELKQSLD